MNKTYIKYLGLGLGGVAVGFGSGWLISKSVTTKKLRVVLEKELKDMEGYFDRRMTENAAKRNLDKPSPQELFEDFHGKEQLAILTEQYQTTDAEKFRELNEGRVPTNEELAAMGDPEFEANYHEELRVTSVFDSLEPEDVGEEVDPPFLVRTPEKPYIIPIGDYMNPEDDFEDYDRITITYYDEDEVLTDDADKVIPDVNKTVGTANLKRFGKDSDNPDIVYIRNEKLRTDFEIARVSGSYTKIVLGFDSKPSARTKRLREDD